MSKEKQEDFLFRMCQKIDNVKANENRKELIKK